MTILRLSQRAIPLASFNLSSTKLLKPSSLPFFFKPSIIKSIVNMATTALPQTVIEHVVLFKVKENTDPSKVTAMFDGLNGLASLDQVLHLTAGPLSRTRTPLSDFTHMLHSRYASKDDLAAYSAHPSHVAVVKELGLPICEDIMAVDWIASDLKGSLVPPPGSALQVTFMKLKENVGEEGIKEVLGWLEGTKKKLTGVVQMSCGENFSPGRAKGFSIASVAVFPGLSEMESAVSKEAENSKMNKAGDYVEGCISVDYMVPSSHSASL